MLTRQSSGHWARRSGVVLLTGALLATPFSAGSDSSPPIEAVIGPAPSVVARAGARAALNPFTDFEDPSLTGYQIKLTYLGSQGEPITTVVAVEEGGTLALDR